MKRELHVFGCSFTDYPQWPIWADWLAMYFPDKSFFKHATGGVGNKAIFNKVINVLSTMDSYQDKVFVIQWGSCAREDRFHKEHNHASTLQSLYQQCGALGNTHCYSKEFVKNDFSFKQAVYEHVNQVYTVAELFKAKKINSVMTYMLDPTIENMLGEPGFNTNNEWASVAEIDNLLPLYAVLKRYYAKYNFTESCMTMDQMNYNDVVYSFVNDENKIMREGHPSPREGYMFMKNHILPMLPFLPQVSDNKIKIIEDLVDEWLEYAKIPKYHLSKQEPKTWPCFRRFGNTSPMAVEKYLGYLYEKI